MKPSFFFSALALTLAVGAAACSSDDDTAKKTTSPGTGNNGNGTGNDGGETNDKGNGGGANDKGGGGPVGDVTCETYKSKCPNEPAPPQEERDTCKAITSSPCADTFQAALNCGASKEVCGADGKKDEDASEAACKAENDAFLECLAAQEGGG